MFGGKKEIKGKRKRTWARQLALGVLDAFLLVVLGAVVGLGLVYYLATPPAHALMTRRVAETSFLYDRSGKQVLYEIHGEENRVVVPHEDIADAVRIATVATEDDAFYRHVGVDPLAIARAMRVNIAREGIRQGGSTITQQLARSVFLSREKTLRRKVLEAVIALKIEQHYDKQQILDAYLNQIPYGSNAYGIQTAARTFFGKDAKDLSLDEAALLAALPKAPTYYSPYHAHSDELIVRQKGILERIAKLELASQQEVDKALREDTLAKVRPLRDEIKAPHFVFYVMEELENKYGRDFLETGGLNVVTTLDMQMQSRGERVVREGAQKNMARGATNAALVAVDPKSGEVLAMVGSRDFFDESIDGQVNVTLRPRQPGSSFKPFAYAAAFEKGYEPETKVLDAPTNFGADGSGRDYIPRNYDGKFHGLMSMREALAQSLNVPAVKTLYLAGIDNTIELAHRLGITTLNDRKRYGLSLVLGGGEVKLLDMAGAFGVFANDGVKNSLHGVLSISDARQKEIFQSTPENKKVLDAQIARRITSILSDNKARTPIFGPRSPLIMPDGRPVAAKTGTTQEFRDAWTVGFTPSLAVGVWAGNNDNRQMKGGSDGVFVAAPIWNAFMRETLAGSNFESFVAYEPRTNMSFAQEKVAGAMVERKVRYFDTKSGEEISRAKVEKMDPEKAAKRVREKIEYVPVVGGAESGAAEKSAKDAETMSLAVPDPTDPMFKRWGGMITNASGALEEMLPLAQP
ncbi:MAG TPA: PBP1A family penicillin-binding protein [Candidatus Moranbacteria bacterium]|nr:PBP1A family penicillin-binding protein [Candidatus Moranbacteria bacterium]